MMFCEAFCALDWKTVGSGLFGNSCRIVKCHIRTDARPVSLSSDFDQLGVQILNKSNGTIEPLARELRC
jgi:hypothetical protein